MYLLWLAIVIIGILFISSVYLVINAMIIARASRKIFDDKFHGKKG